MALVYDAVAMLRPEVAHVSEISLSLSFLLSTTRVVSPPPRVGVRTRGRGIRDVPRKVPVWRGLGGQDLATTDPFSFADRKSVV